jgi:hypothetical protein
MSEFKYACPVCGQHMKCDSTQGGAVMICPTCFQQIVAPQAPTSADSRLILTGSKFVEKKSPAAPVHPSLRGGAAVAARPAEPEKPAKRFPFALVIVIALVVVAGVNIFAFREELLAWVHRVTQTNGASTAGSQAETPVAPVTKSQPAPVANTTAKSHGWTLNLNGVAIPETPVSGRIHDRQFVAEQAVFHMGSLTLRMGSRPQADLAVSIGFGGVTPQALSKQTIHVALDANKAAKIILRWKDSSGKLQQTSYNERYVMRLEFGALVNNQLPGKIYLCTPDVEKSYVMGTFTAELSKQVKGKAK